jgi:hypothetical protein
MEMPIVDIPENVRVKNYAGGSCVYASTESAFMQVNAPDWAAYYRQEHSGGSGAETLGRYLTKDGVRYVQTTSGDVSVLEWAMRTRRMVIIAYHPSHYVNLVHLDSQWAGILNNNHVHDIEWISASEFIRNWKGYGGEATVLLYDPIPPLPRK